MTTRSGRGVAEWLLRLVGVGALLWAMWLAWPRAAARGTVAIDQSQLEGALARWSSGPAPAAAHVAIRVVPDGVQRDWIAALAGAGTRVTWQHVGAGALTPAVVAVEPLLDPAGGVRIGVAAPPGAAVTVRDELGPIGTVERVGNGGASFRGQLISGTTSATVGGVTVRGSVGDSLVLRRLLVVGRAGWEAKFIIRALEEAGWGVDVRLTIAPSAIVAQGVLPSLDTARYAAVIAVDGVSGIGGAALTRYVQSGGGVILVGGAARTVHPLAAGAPGDRIPGRRTLAEEDPRAALTLVPITAIEPGVAPIERRGPVVAAAIRRVGEGRVLQVGYEDSWRWRMAGGDSGLARHRRWWTSQVGAVAYAPGIPRAVRPGDDPAPLAAWIDRLGEPVATAPLDATTPAHSFAPWIFAVAMLALIAETASRRLRGRD